MSNKSELNKTLGKLSSISARASRDKTFKFISLAHLLNVSFLKDCYLNLARNKAIGIDGVSWQEYKINLNRNIEDLVQRLKRKSFKPLPASRVYIPKVMVKPDHWEFQLLKIK